MDLIDSKYQSRLLRLSAHDRKKNRQNETNSDFTLDVKSQNSELKKIVAVQVINAQIPNVFYNIPDGLNTFSYEVGAVPQPDIVIPPGQYELGQLMDVLLGLLDTALALPPNSSTYVFNDGQVTDFKVKITTGAPVSFNSDENDNPIAFKLGFGKQTYADGTEFDAPFIVNLIGPHTVSVHSTQISNPVLDYGASSGTIRLIAQVPLDNPFGQMCYFDAKTSSDLIKYQKVKNWNQIRLILRDNQGRRMDIGNHDWSITLKVWYLL